MGSLKLLRLLDLLFAAVILAVGGVQLAAWLVRARLGWRPPTHPRRVLYIGTGQIAQVFPRNGVNLFLERECSDFDGYFEQMWNVHFPAGSQGALDLTPRHHLIDFDIKPQPWMRSLRFTTTALRQVAFLTWVAPFIRQHGISVVVATNPYLQGLDAAILSFVMGIPFAIIVTRDYDWDWNTLGKLAFPSVFPSRDVEKRIEHLVFSRANVVLADRRYYRDYAVQNGAHRDRAWATRVLADTAFDTARPSDATHAPLSAGPLLSYVGRLDEDKLAMDLAHCLVKVRERFPHARLACAGTGALSEEMQRVAGDHLVLLGSQPLDRLPGLLAASDLVVAAHMGYTLIEAGLTGTPIATYDYDYYGEIVENAQSGWLAPLGDVDSLAADACETLADPGLAAQMGARTRRKLLREHTLSAVVPMYQQAYASVLGRE